jgi:hypothetical protein
MSRKLTASALFVLGLLALTADGQPPGKKPADKKAADPVDALIAAALANDPEVRIARAKVVLADAELAKARQLVTQKVITLRAAIEEQRSAVKLAEATYALMEQRMKAGAAPQTEILEARAKLETAKAKLAQLETELKLITGGDKPGTGSAPLTADDLAQRLDRAVLDFMAQRADDRPAPAGPVPDRIRAALDKKVKLAAKGEDVTFEKALEVFKKDAGLDVPVRLLMKLSPIKSEGEELPLGAWLQMFADFNAPAVILVREYGLLVTAPPMGIPPDAPTITEFWKRAPAVTPANKQSSIRFTGPAGMKVTWQLPGGGFNDEASGLTAPKEYNFLQGQVYRLRLTQVPDFPGRTFYPTLEVSPATPKTMTFLAHSSVPVTFTDEDFRQASEGNLVVKVIYLPDPAGQDLASAKEIVSTRLESGVDPVAEAQRRGTILATIRLGNIDREDKAPSIVDPPSGMAIPGER